MSSLHESLSRRRAEGSGQPACVSLQPGSPALVVWQWRGPCWVLPWSQFTAARLNGGEDDSQLELTFTHCQVVLTGSGLRGLVEELAAFRVSGLRDMPASYRPPVGEGIPFIARIEVRLTAGEIRETPD